MGWESIITSPRCTSSLKKLFIPGPVNTLFKHIDDMAPRDTNSIKLIQNVRSSLLDIYKLPKNKYTTILVPGSGTGCNEAVMRMFSKDKTVDILSNGVYGSRLLEISQYLDLNTTYFNFNNKKKIQLEDYHPKGAFVSMVHHETGTGIKNDIESILDFYPTETITHIDGISTVGGVPFELEKYNVDFFVGSSNKCLHSFAGLSFVIAKKRTLEKLRNNKSSLTLNLYDEWRYMEKTNQFRFTPPIQLVNYLYKSLQQLEHNGGIENRYKKYKRLNKIVRDSLKDTLIEVIEESEQDHLMTLYRHPDPNFNFDHFKQRLLNENIIIQDSVAFKRNLIRIANIGEWNETELYNTLYRIKEHL